MSSRGRRAQSLAAREGGSSVVMWGGVVAGARRRDKERGCEIRV